MTMSSSAVLRLGIKRFVILLIISTVLVLVVSEAAFLVIREQSDRAPQTVELVIPAGTAEKIAQGQPVPNIPEEMVFVVGDTLLVRNMDAVDHQLGPLWVPAGSSASLGMERAERLAYTCTFQSTKYLGLTIKQPTTLKTRLSALALAVPSTAMVLFVYSIIIWSPTSRQIDPGSRQVQKSC
jgi:hypothetical protein